MQVWASVNEADIGAIKKGIPVIFTVDTFPGREFEGVVHKVRLIATMSQNVVTYVVEISTENSDGTLLPYLTANVRFIRQRRNNVLSVSNAALRYMPEDPALVVPEQRKEFIDGIKREKDERILWIKEGKLLKYVKVKSGLATGSASEIISDSIKEGDLVVNGQIEKEVKKSADSAKSGGRSPFMPKMPSRNRNSAKGR
jgi:HlyD family secretion protein